MSAIVICTSKLKNKKDLIEAFKLMGIPPQYIAIADSNEKLEHKGYGTQRESVEVNISKSWHSGYGDVGFDKRSEDTYDIIMDDMDKYKLSNVCGGGDFKQKLSQHYSAAVAIRALKSQGFASKISWDKDKIRVRALGY